MLVNTPQRVAAAVATAVALVLVGLHARACSARRDPGAPPLAACSVAPAPAVASIAAPAAPASAEPATSAAPSDPAPAIPALTLPCITDTTELLAGGGGRPVLCWGQRCLSDPGDAASIVPRPSSEPDTVVENGRACTGSRCDRLGPRLRAAMEGMTDPTAVASLDHAVLVLAGRAADESTDFKAWNRAADRPIDLGSPDEDEGEIERVTVIGDVLIVTRSCSSKGCSQISRILDARGRRRGDAAEPEAPLGQDQATEATIVALDADHRVARDAFDELVMIDHGRVADVASLSDDQMVQLDDHTFAVLRCSGGDPDTACHLIQREVQEQEPGSPGAKIITVDDRRVPRCHPE